MNGDAPGHPTWPLWQRVAVRYLLLHWLLYAFPSPLVTLVVGALRGYRAMLPDGWSLPGWASATLAEMAGWQHRVDQCWHGLLDWLQTRGLTFGLEMHHTATRIGDTAAAWMRVVVIVSLAALGALVWSLLDRSRKGHPRLGRWLHLGARWYLAVVLLSYGLSKLFDGQFPAPTIAELTREVGDLPPDGVLWMFMKRSQPYVWLAGAAELLACVLLLHRRTALLGATVATVVMAQVCALNWLYGVPLKQFTAHLLLIALLLMAPFARRLWAVFVQNGSSEPVDLRVTTNRWLAAALVLFGTLTAIGTATNRILGHASWRERAATTSHAMPHLFGLWRVRSMQLGGEFVTEDQPRRWRDITIDRGNRLRLRSALGRPMWFDCREDLETGTITLLPAGGEQVAWLFERTGDELTLRGDWQGQPLEVQATRKHFLYDQPFWLWRENPR